MDKRLPITIAAVLLTIFVASSDAQQKRPVPKKYRVIFNCDGHAVAKDAKGNLHHWIDNLFTPLQNSHVEALFWCDGAGGNTANYDSQVLERTGARANRPRKYIDNWIKQGNDPPKVIVREAKKRGLDVFFSFRINDIHDSFIPDEMATFKVKHPEWMIGEKLYGKVKSFKSSLNFAYPGVREIKFRVVEELFRKYQFDGLEIDFLRSAPYFLPGTEQKNAKLLTQLLRRIRKHLDKRARERKRPIWLAVRVDESLKSCGLNGFEVKTWVQEGLVDYISLGSGVMDIEVEEFKRLVKGKPIHVYPCLYGWPSRYSPLPKALAAGLATNYWGQGADGIYLFNWFPHTRNNSEATAAYMAEMLKRIGDPKAVLRQPQVMFAADRGRPQRAYQYNWLHCVLPAALSAKPLQVEMRVFAKLQPKAQLQLRLPVTNLRANDRVKVTLNGRPVTGWKRAGGVLQVRISPGRFRVGSNRFQLSAKLDSSSKKPRTATALELVVTQPK